MPIKKYFSIPFVFFLLLATAVQSASLPEPVNGVTFEEWASANGRIADHQDKNEVLAVLGLNKAAFEAVDVAFTEVLKTSSPDSEVFRVYGEAFGDPNRGRFAATQPVDIDGKLATLEDYAKVQGHMQAATELKIDPATVLKEHDLTPYEYSQEAGRWVRVMAMQAAKGGDETLKFHDAIERWKQHYLAELSKG